MTQIIPQCIKNIMEQSFIDYSMSVITERALPDVRDGLKPVHRRIMFAMHEAGNDYNKAYKKSARMVGDVIGKYHPHGDTSVYGAAVRMAQSFSMGAVLIDGQGNFGSIDGDNPAAMRYTEMRLSRLAGEFFSDLEKETVKWRPNYDGSEKEPEVLPTPLPNLLVNGVEGIAVGMASSIPPHNLKAVVEATLFMMDNPDATSADIINILKAPDFPTGALVHSLDGFADAVVTGRGGVKLRCKWHEEERERGARAIVIDELPYQVNKSKLVAKIADLVRDKEVEDIVNMRDESNKDGIRIWIALKKDASVEAIASELCSKTEMETTVSYNCVVLVDGKPRQIGLMEIIQEWIKFRQEVVLGRFIYDRKQAQAKLHILAGYMAALGQLDAVIKTIREASNPGLAKASLIELLSVDEIQAQAILELRLQKLTGMELDSIRTEHTAFTEKVAALTVVIESPEKIRDVIRGELIEVSKRHGVDRQTEIGHGIGEITREDLIPREDVLLMMTNGGYIKRLPANALERQGRGTRGKKGIDIGEDDTINFLREAHSHDLLMVFAKSGQVYGIKAYRIPEGSLTQKPRHIRNVIEGLDEQVHAVVSVSAEDATATILTVTKSGQIKRTSVEDYSGATRKGGIRGVGLDEGDELVGAFTVRDEDHVMLIANTGKAIRFQASDARVMGRTAAGVRGIRLDEGEYLVGSAIIPNGKDDALYLLCIGKNGIGKRTSVDEFSPQGRGGSGMIAFKANAKTGELVAAMGVTKDEDLIMLTSNGVTNRISVPEIRETGRSASGVILINLDAGQTLVGVTTTVRTEDENEATDAMTTEAAE
jgi:DNA gyrase subunit A